MPVERDADGRPIRITDPTGTAEEKRVLREWLEWAATDKDVELAAMCRDVLDRPERYPAHLPEYAERILAVLRIVEAAKRRGDARDAARFAGTAWQFAQEAASKRDVERSQSFTRSRGPLRELLTSLWREMGDAPFRDVFDRIRELHTGGDPRCAFIDLVDAPDGEPRESWALIPKKEQGAQKEPKPIQYRSAAKTWERVRKAP